jgi:hypothetical protein
MATLTLDNEISTPIKIMPPAMPNTPDMKAVMALAHRIMINVRNVMALGLGWKSLLCQSLVTD